MAGLEEQLRVAEVELEHHAASVEALNDGKEQPHSPQPQPQQRTDDDDGDDPVDEEDGGEQDAAAEEEEEEEERFEAAFKGEGRLGLTLNADEEDSEIFVDRITLNTLAAFQPALQAHFDCARAHGDGGPLNSTVQIVLRRIGAVQVRITRPLFWSHVYC